MSLYLYCILTHKEKATNSSICIYLRNPERYHRGHDLPTTTSLGLHPWEPSHVLGTQQYNQQVGHKEDTIKTKSVPGIIPNTPHS